jgi:hypothetical protein
MFLLADLSFKHITREYSACVLSAEVRPGKYTAAQTLTAAAHLVIPVRATLHLDYCHWLRDFATVQFPNF